MLLVCIHDAFVECGDLKTGPELRTEIEWTVENVAEAMQTVIEFAVDTGTNPRAELIASLVVLVVEPPLFDIRIKQQIADVLLNEIGVRALVYLSRSVCCCTGACESGQVNENQVGAIVRDNNFLVPVYDTRELCTQIKARGEFNDNELINRIKQSSAVDLRKYWDFIIDMDSELIWKGARKLAKSNIGPVLARGGRERVWDALYDWDP